jgi:hypothetical protein
MYRQSIRAALLLALMIVLQSLRLLIPLPPFISLFAIGSAVNACLLLAVETISTKAAVIIAGLSPFVAFFQQALPLPLFILPVAVTNMAFVVVYRMTVTHSRWLAVSLAAITRLAVLYITSSWAFRIADLPPGQASVLQAVMSWPQLITGIAGGIFCWFLLKRLTLNAKTKAE